MSAEARLAERIRRLVAEGRDAGAGDALVDDAPLYGSGLGLHSLEVVALVVRLEEEFGIAIEDDEVPRDRLTIRGLCRLVRHKLDQRAPAPGPT